jgi:hypothetical protein
LWGAEMTVWLPSSFLLSQGNKGKGPWSSSPGRLYQRNSEVSTGVREVGIIEPKLVVQ